MGGCSPEGTGRKETEIVKIVELLNCYHQLTACQATLGALYHTIYDPPNSPFGR